MSVNDQILDAIELLAKTSVERAGYDKTIQAQIISCQDPSIGKYKCKYQDATFYAYTGKSDMLLTNGIYVYVLVPENDMSKEKTIIGTVDKLGVDYRTSVVGEEAYDIIGSDVLNDYSVSWFLDTQYKNYYYDLYVSDGAIDGYLGLDESAFRQYIKQASSLIIAMTIRTTIATEKQRSGNYGIQFVLEFKNQEDHNKVDRVYTFDVNKMTGNPYNYSYGTRQYAIFDIDGKNFEKIKQIRIFNRDFPGSSGEFSNYLISGDIQLTNLQLKCATRMSQEELNGLGLSFIVPSGTAFLNNQTQNKTIQAQVKFKGIVIPPENVSFYWGTQDLQINPQRQTEYNKYLGRGWRCINNYNIIQPQGGERSLQWVSYGDTYIFQYNSNLFKDNRIKVAAVYDGNVITKQINIQNLTSNAVSLVINSSAGTQFYYGIGQTELECNFATPYGVSQPQPQGSWVYAWGWQNNGGELQQYTETTKTKIIEARYITNFAVIKCSIYDRYQEDGQYKDHYRGTASIKIVNSMQGEGINPLVIQNGTALYKYNEKGISPASRTLQNPQIIQVLKFKIHDDMGNEIEIFHGPDGLRSIDSRASVKWHIPKNNTLLVLPDLSTATSQATQYIVSNTETLTYDIAQRYDIRKNNNQIVLQVTYDGATSYAQTNLTFTKQGQIGTNGTDYYVEILPNTLMANPPLFPMITKIGNDFKLNYTIQRDSITTSQIYENTPQQLLKVRLLHGGEQVSLGQNDSIKWRVLKNHYYSSGNNSIDDVSDFSIPDNDNSKLIYNHSLTASNSQVAANIIECQITYDGHTYYSAIPFITAYMTSEAVTFDLVDGTGFHYVMYSSEGMQPEYSSLPFEFTDGNNGTCTVLGNIQVKNGNTWIPQNSGDLVQDSQDPFKIQPIGFYKGECVNNSVRYTGIDENNNPIGIINIPIHFYLNRYNFAHLNGWDGNSIQINNEDGYILAPQMGAGKKEDDNSFTGVLMGQVKNPMKNQSDIGLFGYAQGARSFFINSKNGSAIFGKSGNGEIIIDPQNNKAMLYSHSYWTRYKDNGLPNGYTPSGNGMLIDLSTPEIRFGNGKFYVNSQGLLHAQNATVSGTITASTLNLIDNATVPMGKVDGLTQQLAVYISKDGTISNNILDWTEDYGTYSKDTYVIYSNKIYKCTVGHTSNESRAPTNSNYWQEVDGDISSSAFLVSSGGLLTASNAIIYGTLYSSAGKIGGWTVGNNKLYTDPNNNGIGGQNSIYFMPTGTNTATVSGQQRSDWTITAGTDFGVTRSGNMFAKSGKMGGAYGWTLGGDNNKGWIYSNSKSSMNSTNPGIYFGTDGISIRSTSSAEIPSTQTFRVDSDGDVHINANITLGPSSTLSWDNITDNTIPDLATISYNSTTGDYSLININVPKWSSDQNYSKNDYVQLGGVVYKCTQAHSNSNPHRPPNNDYWEESQYQQAIVPSYITSTKITQTTIESPTIYAGKFYATGQGYSNGAAYYIYNGDPRDLGSTQVGYISYDTHGTGGDAANRVFFTTLNNTALKFYAGGDISLDAGTTDIGYFGTIYMQSDTLFSGDIRLKTVQRWGGINNEYHGAYGTDSPATAFGNSVSTGQLYFKIIN